MKDVNCTQWGAYEQRRAWLIMQHYDCQGLFNTVRVCRGQQPTSYVGLFQPAQTQAEGVCQPNIAVIVNSHKPDCGQKYKQHQAKNKVLGTLTV